VSLGGSGDQRVAQVQNAAGPLRVSPKLRGRFRFAPL
jgi:hypothetical protein